LIRLKKKKETEEAVISGEKLLESMARTRASELLKRNASSSLLQLIELDINRLI
jgi:hypothetical protein